MVLRYFLKGLLLPPAGLLLMALAGLLLRRRYPRAAGGLLAVGLLSLLGLSLPWTALHLLRSLESEPALSPQALGGIHADAIVVLSAGRYLPAPEYDHPRPDPGSLERVEYAAWLARRTQLPVIATGGAVFADGPSAAELMADTLQGEFGVAQVRAETASQTTWENALYTRRLFPAGARPTVLLVTHAWHMPRSAWAFREQGFAVIPAPTRFAEDRYPQATLLDFLPSHLALADSTTALHEWLGIASYRLLYAVRR